MMVGAGGGFGAYRGNKPGALVAGHIAGSCCSAFSLAANCRIGVGYGWAKAGTGAGRDARQLSPVGTADLSRRTMLYPS